jgi:hypothetical protein
MEGGASHAKEDAELPNHSSVPRERLLSFGNLSHCQPGCVGEDAFSTYVPAGPTCRQCQLLESRADIGLTDLGSEPDSRRTHHYQEQIG